MIASANHRLRQIPTWPLYLIAPVPVVWLFWQGAIGGLGVEPVEVIEHQLGLWGLWGLIIGLCVSPLRRHVGLNLIKFRRAFGLITFFYISLHLAVWAVLDVQFVSQMWADIVKRPYITIGMLSFAMMVPLALTSSNAAIRWMGAVQWQRLHRLTYGVALLGALHFVMLSKGFQLEPLLYMCAVIVLITLRTLPKRHGSRMRAAS